MTSGAFRALTVHSSIIQNLAGKPPLTLRKPTARLPDLLFWVLHSLNKSKEIRREEEEEEEGRRRGRTGAVLTDPRLQGQDQDQGADDQLQTVEWPFPIPIVLVGVHNRYCEQQQELHRQLGGDQEVVSTSGGFSRCSPTLQCSVAAKHPQAGPAPHLRARCPRLCFRLL